MSDEFKLVEGKWLLKLILLAFTIAIVFTSIGLYHISSAFGESTDDLFYLSLEQINNQEFEHALHTLDCILEMNPDHQEALSNKGGVLLELGRNEEVIPLSNRLLELNPDNVKAMNNKAIALLRMEHFVPSLNIFYDAFKIDPYNQITIKNIEWFIENYPYSFQVGHASIVLRDKDDNLIGIQETDRVYVLIPFGYRFLEEFADKTQVTIDGINYNKFTLYRIHIIDDKTMYPLTKFHIKRGDTLFTVIEIAHDGFITDVGDVVYVYLTVLQKITEPEQITSKVKN